MADKPGLERLVYAATSQHDELMAMLLRFSRESMSEDDCKELLWIAEMYRLTVTGIYNCARRIAGSNRK